MIVGTDGGFYATWDRTRNWEHLNHAGARPVLRRRDRHAPAVPRVRRPAGQRELGRAVARARRARDHERGLDLGRRRRRVRLPHRSVRSRHRLLGEPGRRDGPPQPPDGTSARASRRGRSAASSYRFNWNTPFILSSHNPGIFYCGGNFVFRSFKRGDDLKVDLAGDLADGPRHRDGARRVADERRRALVRYGRRQPVGDQGRRRELDQRRRQGRAARPALGLDDRALALRRGPLLRRVRRATAATTTSPTSSRPRTSARRGSRSAATSPRARRAACARTSKNRELLFCGTEFAAWASLDRGETWTKINSNLPTVAVHEFAFHPRRRSRRGDARPQPLGPRRRPLRQMTAEALAAPAWLYEPTAVVRWRSEPERGVGSGASASSRGTRRAGRDARLFDHEEGRQGVDQHRRLQGSDRSRARGEERAGPPRGHVGPRGPAPPRGAESRPGAASRASSRPTSRPASRPCRRPPGQQGGPGGGGPGGGGPGGGGPGGFQGRGGRPVPLGVYRVILTVDGKDLERTLRIEGDPTLPPDIASLQGMQEEEGADDPERARRRRERNGIFDDGF